MRVGGRPEEASKTLTERCIITGVVLASSKQHVHSSGLELQSFHRHQFVHTTNTTGKVLFSFLFNTPKIHTNANTTAAKYTL